MKLTTDSKGGIILEEVYCGLSLKTREGNEYGICMRDDTIEIIPIGSAPAPRIHIEPTEISEEVGAAMCAVLDRWDGTLRVLAKYDDSAYLDMLEQFVRIAYSEPTPTGHSNWKESMRHSDYIRRVHREILDYQKEHGYGIE